MNRLKLNKNELRRQKDHLKRFERYLPMLLLKKQQLRLELDRISHERAAAEEALQIALQAFTSWKALWGEDIELDARFGIRRVEVSWDNIAGVDIPVFEGIQFRLDDYDLFATPLWTDRALEDIQEITTLQARLIIVREQERIIAREWRVTAQRVNLFEHIKIPEARNNIRTITVALTDQQTTAFGWSLMTKRKLEAAS